MTILKDPFSRQLSVWAILLTGLGWLVFKIIYPYPDLVFDSYHYIHAAASGLRVNAWPIGYSWCLVFFHWFSASAAVFTGFQYLFLELSCWVFFMTWRTLYHPSRGISILLLVGLFCNPLFMYCCNFLMADPLFISLSLLWFTQLLWLLHRPRVWMIVSNALLLGAAFTVRYNALYYPLVAAIAILCSRLRLWQKVVGILLPMVWILFFVRFTSKEMAAVCGVRQFSPFAGWKLANDALYAYGPVARGNPDPVPDRFRLLDSVVRHYFNTTRNRENLLETEKTSGSPFMFYDDSPLLEYMYLTLGPGGLPFNTPKWMAIAPLYQEYGSWLAKKYPIAFTEYFLLPNALRYFVPPGENLPSTEPFYYHESAENRMVREQFGFTASLPKHPFIRLQQVLLAPYPALFGFFHLLFILGFLGFSRMGGLKECLIRRDYTFFLVLSLWLIDFGFSVLSAGVVLRYEIFVHVIEMGYGLYMIRGIYHRLGAPQRGGFF